MADETIGVLNILSGIIVILFLFDVLSFIFVLIVIAYMIIKMIIFHEEPLQMIDGLIALIILFNLIYQLNWVNYITIAYLLIKGAYLVIRK